MGAMAKYDAEKLLLEIRAKIVANYNTKLLDIQTDKAKDGTNPVIASFKKLGGGILGDSITSTPEEAIDLLGLKAAKMQAYDPYMIIQFAGNGVSGVQNAGQEIVDVAILVSMIDPRDYTGELRMLRYIRALKELFEPYGGFGTGCVSLNGTELLPYLAAPDYWDTNKKRLTWGLGLKLTY